MGRPELVDPGLRRASGLGRVGCGGNRHFSSLVHTYDNS
jgi:hypothetical protein